MTERGPLPRLVINYAAPDLEVFAQIAEAAAQQLSDRYDVRMVVSHLARKDVRQRRDPGDPYLEYSANFPDIFHFVVPDALRAGTRSGAGRATWRWPTGSSRSCAGSA